MDEPRWNECPELYVYCLNPVVRTEEHQVSNASGVCGREGVMNLSSQLRRVRCAVVCFVMLFVAVVVVAFVPVPFLFLFLILFLFLLLHLIQLIHFIKLMQLIQLIRLLDMFAKSWAGRACEAAQM